MSIWNMEPVFYIYESMKDNIIENTSRHFSLDVYSWKEKIYFRSW